jgi:hypothetical protein
VPVDRKELAKLLLPWVLRHLGEYGSDEPPFPGVRAASPAN